MNNEVLNVEQAAKLLGVSVWSMRKLARQGTVIGNRVGKSWRFLRSNVLAVLEPKTNETNSEGPPRPLTDLTGFDELFGRKR